MSKARLDRLHAQNSNAIMITRTLKAKIPIRIRVVRANIFLGESRGANCNLSSTPARVALMFEMPFKRTAGELLDQSLKVAVMLTSSLVLEENKNLTRKENKGKTDGIEGISHQWLWSIIPH